MCEKNFLFEMTVSFTMHPDQPGMIDCMRPHKCPDLLKPIFHDGTRITTKMGESLAEWALGDETAPPDEALWRDAREAANLGTVKLRDYAVQGLSKDDSARLRPIRRELNDTAKAADANTAGPAPAVEEYLEDQ